MGCRNPTEPDAMEEPLSAAERHPAMRRWRAMERAAADRSPTMEGCRAMNGGTTMKS